MYKFCNRERKLQIIHLSRIQNEIATRPSRCTPRSHRTGVPIGLVREGRRANLIEILRAFGLAKDRMVRLAIKTSSRGRSSIMPSHHIISPVSRSLPLLPSRSTFLAVDAPCHLEGRGEEGGRDSKVGKTSDFITSLVSFSHYFPKNFWSCTRVHL
jgi:hypothetical protein